LDGANHALSRDRELQGGIDSEDLVDGGLQLHDHAP
jgi:hypothetical protein